MHTLIRITAAFAFLAITATSAVANSPEKQLAFAEDLMENGDEAFALLEFKRFLFQSPTHAKAPDALYRVAQIRLSYLQDVDGARKTLRDITSKYPKSQTASRAKAFADYIEVNSDFGAKPLLSLLAARSDEKAGKYQQAASAYQKVLTDYPRARLAPTAALDLASLNLERLKQPAAARNALRWLIQNHPKSEMAQEARLMMISCDELEAGPSAAIAAQYRDFAARYPKTDLAKKALAKAEAVEKKAFTFKRQFDKRFVRTYAVKQQGYRSRTPGVYVVDIEIPKDSSERDVKATLESALLTDGAKRTTPKHTVTVSAYFSYPLTEAGSATWQPGSAPTYRIPERKSEDVIKDVFIDLLRR